MHTNDRSRLAAIFSLKFLVTIALPTVDNINQSAPFTGDIVTNCHVPSDEISYHRQWHI
jgi:hypothetical protein